MNNGETVTGAAMKRFASRVVLCLACVCGPPVLAADGSSANRAAVDEMRLTSAGVFASAWQSSQGTEESFVELDRQVDAFDREKGGIDSAELASELSQLDVSWQPVKRAARILVDAAPEIVFVHRLAAGYADDVDAMQREFAVVVDVANSAQLSPATVAVAQSNLWLSERIGRNLGRIMAGEGGRSQVPEELQSDTSTLLKNIEALTRGDAARGVDKVADPKAIEAMSLAFRRFTTISTSVDRVVASAGELRDAADARARILSSATGLEAAINSLGSAIDRQSGTGESAFGTTVIVLGGLLVAAILLLGFLVVSRQKRIRQFTSGTAAINTALQKIGQGDLMAEVAAVEGELGELVSRINGTTHRQRELVQNIRAPFEMSVEEINRIGVTARSLVEKGKELTRSVGESITAATEMVRTSEEIKTSTAEAARTSDRNCQKVAQGYELTKDMSKASADVRESVQETSKSAKRQGELIQSVTAAAEYIQALNTKISVVAINTRIEAEKAGEYGRPFLGIAESIADLLREAGDEGRKILSEVRMLQNMSAENLSSMENTVGTVVTILEYIERLDSSLEEINAGSAAISSIIRSVDEAAAQSAVSALHMNSSMAQIRERNLEIGKFSESTRMGVARLQRTMRDASESLGKFRAEGRALAGAAAASGSDGPGDLEPIGATARVYREEDMSALETGDRNRAAL